MPEVGPLLGSATRSLVGRAADLAVLDGFLDRTAVRGGALVLAGAAGVGKTVLLDAAAERAEAAGTTVARSAGAEFEADVSFSGLNQVVHHLLEHIEALPTPLRVALSVALGFGDGPPPGRLVVSNAVVQLLCNARVAGPLVLILDDVQWLDRSSGAVLGSVARRLDGTGVGLLGALRSPAESFFESTGIPEHEVGALDEEAAFDLLNRRFPALTPRVRNRVLADAQGNPLALLELPTSLTSEGSSARWALPAALPLSRRLQSLFDSRIRGLSAPCRELLLVAALDGSGGLPVVEAAASGTDGLEQLAPAERADLIKVDEGARRLHFRHPLIPSAVVDLSTGDERRRAHHSLADLLDDQPEHRAWHLAQASTQPDEAVAATLELAAHRILGRGDSVAAVTWLTRAADLSTTVVERSRRLAEAAFIAADVTGDLHSVSQLLEDRRGRLDQGESLQTAVMAAYLLLNGEGDIDTAHRLLVGAIDTHADPSDATNVALMEALHTLLLVSFFGGRAELWEPFERAMVRLGSAVPPILYFCAATSSDPARTAGPALEPLDAQVDRLGDEHDPAVIVRTAIASLYVDRLGGCRQALWRVVHDGRAGGAVASAINGLMMLWMDHFLSGEWAVAQQLAVEGYELADCHGYRLLAAPGLYGQGLIAAGRGADDDVRELTHQMIRWAGPRGVREVEMYAWHVQSLAALGRGDFEAAYAHASAISPAGTLASHVAQALWVPLDLVEAAARTGRLEEARAHVAAIEVADLALLSPRLALLARGSAAVAAPDDRARDLFEEALAVAGVDRFPFELARVQLLYGERLRRARAAKASRRPLAAAFDAFERLGARPWAARARAELRAAGDSTTVGARAGIGSLTPQEREIAELAAGGLTNREIGAQLFLSPRTVSAHLYRIFPKLGITSRAALRDALAD
ncbi:MAG: ATP-binding protein [Acidimicrobiia bacterium]